LFTHPQFFINKYIWFTLSGNAAPAHNRSINQKISFPGFIYSNIARRGGELSSVIVAACKAKQQTSEASPPTIRTKDHLTKLANPVFSYIIPSILYSARPGL